MNKYLGEFNKTRYLAKVFGGIAFGIVGVIYVLYNQTNADLVNTFFEFALIAECVIFGFCFIVEISKYMRRNSNIVGYDIYGQLMILFEVLVGCFIGAAIGGVLFAVETVRFGIDLSKNRQSVNRKISE